MWLMLLMWFNINKTNKIMRKIQLLLFTALIVSCTSQAQYKLPQLNYGYADLEPYIDSTTMYIHYNNHHAAYTNNLNAALSKYPELFKKDLIEIFQNFDELPAAQKPGGLTELKELIREIETNTADIHQVILWVEVGEKIQSSIWKSSSDSFWFRLGMVD